VGGAIGDCTIDQFVITAPGNKGSPPICGFNTGQHCKNESNIKNILQVKFVSINFEALTVFERAEIWQKIVNLTNFSSIKHWLTCSLKK
jgi:hypothetical protein